MSVDSRIGVGAGARMFDPLNPAPNDIHIEDIAHALSNLCRFGGHTSEFYSVAQHSVLVSEYAPAWAMVGLLHDSAEAYLGDMLYPLKRSGDVLGERFIEIEKRVLAAIESRFRLTKDRLCVLPRLVKEGDERLLLAEVRDFMGDPDHWGGVNEFRARNAEGAWPSKPIEAWRPAKAKAKFLARYYALKANS